MSDLLLRALIVVGGVVLLRAGDFVLVVIAAPALAAWMLSRAWRDARQARHRTQGQRLALLGVDITTAAAWLVAGGDRVQDELRVSEPPPPSIATQALGAALLATVLIGAVWALATLTRPAAPVDPHTPGD